jgi:raffinose/stachyose/melibiose transport system substrate-binding protein
MVDDSLEVNTFALPVSDDPDDRQARVNVDLALYIPERTRHQGAAEDLVEFLMRPEIIDAYNRDNLAFSTTDDAPAQEDPRVTGLQTYIDRAAFYQGAGTFIPTAIPLGNYLQAAIGSGDFDSMLRQLDADWRRLAGREATT